MRIQKLCDQDEKGAAACAIVKMKQYATLVLGDGWAY